MCIYHNNGLLQSLNLKRSTRLPNCNLLEELVQATREFNKIFSNEMDNKYGVIILTRDKYITNNLRNSSEYKLTTNGHKKSGQFLSEVSILDFNIICAQPYQIAVTDNNSIFNSQYQ